MLTSAVLSFLLPISGISFTGHLIAKTADPNSVIGAPVAAGIALGGVVSGLLGFVGFFLGIVFLIVGLPSSGNLNVRLEQPLW